MTSGSATDPPGFTTCFTFAAGRACVFGAFSGVAGGALCVAAGVAATSGVAGFASVGVAVLVAVAVTAVAVTVAVAVAV
ncbi:MAG TPA: hypothetical protein PKD61_24220, partial [Polyangiaceae bacterium]|nr:hypothetical protein [Polyangiaceae bacterium]